MNYSTFIFFTFLTLSLCVSLAWVMQPEKSPQAETPAEMLVAHLGQGDARNFEKIRQAFRSRNPGYDMQYLDRVKAVPAKSEYRLAFVQGGSGTATLAHQQSQVTVGDIVYLDKNESLRADSLLDLLIFTVPEALPDKIPDFIRPDWDPNITDVPGGCATENNAYRRILLTWQGKVGHYLYHALNAHRVRIMNSFTHYHPEEGGFDEFYLVQMVMPGAHLITSEHTELIRQPGQVSREQAGELLEKTELQVGDLVYLPRGVAHRGYGGVLAQVITVPGFIPGSELGLDHHLRAINEELGLEEEAKLPYNEFASRSEVIK